MLHRLRCWNRWPRGSGYPYESCSISAKPRRQPEGLGPLAPAARRLSGDDVAPQAHSAPAGQSRDHAAEGDGIDCRAGGARREPRPAVAVSVRRASRGRLPAPRARLTSASRGGPSRGGAAHEPTARSAGQSREREDDGIDRRVDRAGECRGPRSRLRFGASPPRALAGAESAFDGAGAAHEPTARLRPAASGQRSRRVTAQPRAPLGAESAVDGGGRGAPIARSRGGRRGSRDPPSTDSPEKLGRVAGFAAHEPPARPRANPASAAASGRGLSIRASQPRRFLAPSARLTAARRNVPSRDHAGEDAGGAILRQRLVAEAGRVARSFRISGLRCEAGRVARCRGSRAYRAPAGQSRECAAERDCLDAAQPRVSRCRERVRSARRGPPRNHASESAGVEIASADSDEKPRRVARCAAHNPTQRPRATARIRRRRRDARPFLVPFRCRASNVAEGHRPVTLRADRARRKGDGRNNRLTRRAAESGLAVVVSARRVRAAGLSLDWRAMQVLRPVSKYYAVRKDLTSGIPVNFPTARQPPGTVQHEHCGRSTARRGEQRRARRHAKEKRTSQGSAHKVLSDNNYMARALFRPAGGACSLPRRSQADRAAAF